MRYASLKQVLLRCLRIRWYPNVAGHHRWWWVLNSCSYCFPAVSQKGLSKINPSRIQLPYSRDIIIILAWPLGEDGRPVCLKIYHWLQSRHFVNIVRMIEWKFYLKMMWLPGMTLLKREACHLPAHAKCMTATADSKETSEVTGNFQGHATLAVDQGCSPEAAFGQKLPYLTCVWRLPDRSGSLDCQGLDFQVQSPDKYYGKQP